MNNTTINNSRTTKQSSNTEVKQRKTFIMNNLFQEVNFDSALAYSKKHIDTIKLHRNNWFNNDLTNSLKNTILHLANLKFGFIKHSIANLNKVYNELLPDNTKMPIQKSMNDHIKCKNYDDCINKNLDTKGRITFSNDKYFIGKIMDGLYYDGTINLKSKYGDICEQKLEKGNRFGFKKITWDNGDTYEGQWKNRQWHGDGKFTSNNGDTYEGQWENGQKHGYGTMIWKNGHTYEGQWENGQRHGYGKFTSNNGDTYEGKWENGKEHGDGTMIWDNGDTYEGQWENGQKHGYGKNYLENW